MTLRPCMQCGEPSSDTRCPAHRLPCTKPSRQSRGYDAAWQKLSTRARRLQPFCSRCGAVDDLQADHTPEAWERHDAGLPIRLSDIQVLCGPCNRDAGAARGGSRVTRPTGDAPSDLAQHPNGKAQVALHTPGGYA